MSARHVVGLDVGSTYIKAVLVDEDGRALATARRATPWRSLPGGSAEMTPDELLSAVDSVLAELGEQGLPVAAVGVSGMAESGALLDADDTVVGPVVAWFDPRGRADLDDLPADLRDEFPGRTGLPLSPLATVAKLWHRSRHDGLQLAGRQWLNVPELVVWWLGGERRNEVSLAARTGLVDQDTGQVWARALEVLGADATLLPGLSPAGSVWGLAERHVPAPMQGAVLTVAGHDHLVASAACGVLDVHTLYDSMGTAEALVRVLDGVLDAPARARLAGHGVNVVRHMLPGRGVMLAGTKSGLLLRRVLQLVGVGDPVGRGLLDDQVMALPVLPADDQQRITVSGATNDDGVLALRTDADGLSPALLFDAALRHGSQVLSDVLAHMDEECPPATVSVVAGGWSSMRSVRRARQDLLPRPRFSDRSEDTAHGAALVAAFAADPTADDLAGHLAQHLGDDPPGPVRQPRSTHPTPQGAAR